MGPSFSSRTLNDVIAVISLEDDDFFALDPAALSALQSRVAELVVPPPLSLPPSPTRTPLPELRAASAPATVEWSRCSKLPLVVAAVRSNRREWEVHGHQNRWLFVSNLDTGAVDVTAPLDPGRRLPKRPPSRSGAPPDAINASVSSITVGSYDLLTWFTREQLRGRLAVTFLEFDLASNTCLVTATGEGAAPASGAALWAGSRIAARAALPESKAPAAEPVVVRVPETSPAREPASPTTTAPTQLVAHVRLPRTRATVIAAPHAGWASPFVLAATVVLVRLDGSMPLLSNLAAPAFPGRAVDEIESAFTVDLPSALAGRADPGDWLVYLVLGDTVTAPRPLRITAA